MMLCPTVLFVKKQLQESKIPKNVYSNWNMSDEELFEIMVRSGGNFEIYILTTIKKILSNQDFNFLKWSYSYLLFFFSFFFL